MRNSEVELFNLIARAERNSLLPGEAQILREAIVALGELQETVDQMCACKTGGIPIVRYCEGYCRACGRHLVT